MNDISIADKGHVLPVAPDGTKDSEGAPGDFLTWRVTDTENGSTANTGTGTYDVRGHGNQWGCLRDGGLCGLFKEMDEAKDYAARLHVQLTGNPWLLKELA